ncbi:MAG: glycosyltransferase family 2 protein [Candidatus Aenigmarchaeota archaeon]|nr:glycosyltransferase family 2 protein [Candidatus Aenigmarchaeota archaeon]MDW8159905.1 glycosyltransferase family 2 protein [Candidatus Aenigmarchaeota archaeon]
MERFDVCIPTLNSAKTLERCLKSVVSSIPYRKIIVIDGYSSDETLEIAKKYGCEVYRSKKSLGEVREMLIKKVKTEWFFFIDADIEVNEKWFRILKNSRDEKVGAVNGFGLTGGFFGFLRKILLFFKLKFGIKQRGFTSNTLIRKRAVKGIKLPRVKRLEDIVLQESVEERGYKWKFVLAFCRHMKTERQVLKEALRDLRNLSKQRGIINGLLRI